VPRWRKMILPGIMYCSVHHPPLAITRGKEGEGGREGDVPPDFLAPSRFPGPSLALLTAPCCACDAWWTKIRGLSASAAKESFRHVVDVPEGAERAIEVIAARSGDKSHDPRETGHTNRYIYYILLVLINTINTINK
jgi:hypothetical protein